MIPVDGDFILEVAPRFSGTFKSDQAVIVGAISGRFAQTLERYGISSYLRIAHFMGQVTHECAGFRTTEEFASGAKYEWREDLGNVNKGDGRKYKGRGLIQLTGRFNYTKMAETLSLPLVENPGMAAEPLLSLTIACEYWKSHGINDPADDDDLIEVTRRVNGKLNGLEDRRFYLGRAKAALKRMQGVVVASSQGGTLPVLRRGSAGSVVGDLQRMLRGKGFLIAVDDDFGPATELAVVGFQNRAGLEADGIVGRDTWKALRG